MTSGSFIEFDLTEDTLLDDHQELVIDNCEFKNFYYEMNSFIQLNEWGGHITITNSKFLQMSFCGSFISNREMYYYERTDLDDNVDTELYQQNANNYQKELFANYKYQGISTLDPFNGNCNTGASDTTNMCFGLSITGSTFEDFGKHKDPVTGPYYVDAALGMQFYGSIIDLKSFRGDVFLNGNTFTENIVQYDNCDAAAKMIANTNDYSGTNDNYPSYESTGKTV